VLVLIALGLLLLRRRAARMEGDAPAQE